LWQPPGRANTIAVNYAHVIRNIDEDINQRLFRRPRLNEGPWLGKTGLVAGVEDWEQPHIDWPAATTGHAIATPSGVDKTNIHFREAGDHVGFGEGGVKALIGDAVAVKHDPVAVLERKVFRPSVRSGEGQ